jgi:hypothetical protein
VSRPPVGYVRPVGCTGLNCVPWSSYHAPNCALRLAQEAATLAGSIDRPPVALAVGNSDACARCRRPLNVNEPVYRGFKGAIICAACHDQGYGGVRVDPPARPAPDVTPPAELRTSALMRRCATLLLESSLPGTLKEIVRGYANELHGRAFEIERVADQVTDDGPTGFDRAGLATLLRQIGEVRS